MPRSPQKSRSKRRRRRKYSRKRPIRFCGRKRSYDDVDDLVTMLEKTKVCTDHTDLPIVPYNMIRAVMEELKSEKTMKQVSLNIFNLYTGADEITIESLIQWHDKERALTDQKDYPVLFANLVIGSMSNDYQDEALFNFATKMIAIMILVYFHNAAYNSNCFFKLHVQRYVNNLYEVLILFDSFLHNAKLFHMQVNIEVVNDCPYWDSRVHFRQFQETVNIVEVCNARSLKGRF